MSKTGQQLVWDPLLRIFHWLLVACFLIAYTIEDEMLNLHVLLGSIVLGLILFRLFWGVAGTKHARFSDFIYSVKAITEHLRGLLHFRSPRHTGHTPAGSVMIFFLLVGLLLLTMSGFLLYTLENNIAVLAGMSLDTVLLIENLHGLIADVLMLSVLLHVAGVVVETVLQKQNLVRAMITGYKKVEK